MFRSQSEREGSIVSHRISNYTNNQESEDPDPFPESVLYTILGVGLVGLAGLLNKNLVLNRAPQKGTFEKK